MGVALNGKDDIRMLQSALMIGVFGVLTLTKAPHRKFQFYLFAFARNTANMFSKMLSIAAAGLFFASKVLPDSVHQGGSPVLQQTAENGLLQAS